MAKADDQRSHLASRGAGEKICKRSFRPEIYEEPQNVCHEAGQNVGCLNIHQGVSFANNFVTTGKSELEQMLKQMTFTRCEAQHLISLLNSRIIEESPTPPLRLEASTTISMKKHKHRDERDNLYASVVSSKVLEGEIASPANAYKGSSSGAGQALIQDSMLIDNNAACLSITSVALPQHPMTMEKLPDEILLNIFIRLLAKQLAQMRSVSKSWNSILSHPSFVKSHLHRSIHNNDQVLLIFHDEEESSSDSKPFTAKLSRSPCLELTNFIKLPVNPSPQYADIQNGIRVIGSVNGLICSRYGDSVIHIWNPSLSAVLTLPPYSTPPRCYDDSIKLHFGFGFDPKTDDYKVVKLTCLACPFVNVVEWWLQIEIYSIRKGSWEMITERFPSRIPYILNNDYVCVDGHLYWLGENMNLEKIIVAFDLGSQTFRELPLLDSTLAGTRLNHLGVLCKKLCVISHVWADGTFEVWVMEEYLVAESWVKRHVFSHFTNSAWVFGFTSRNELLIDDDGYLVLFDPSANKQRILEDRCPEDYGVNNIVEYVDSLIWVAPAEHEMMVDDGGQD